MPDRHARAHHSAVDPARRPPAGYRGRGRDRFQRVVRDVVRSLPPPVLAEAGSFEVLVLDVPEHNVELAHFGDGVLTVYRGPVELRANGREELLLLLTDVIIQAIAPTFDP